VKKAQKTYRRQSLLVDDELKERLSKLPEEAGVYLMKDAQAKVLYVGKAKNLKKRVSGYFQCNDGRGLRIEHLMAQVCSLQLIITQNDVEALILEANRIKALSPKYNILLRDDKSYPYLFVDRSHDFPRVYLRRRKMQSDKGDFFGPFPRAASLWEMIKISSKIFRMRDCRDHEFANRSRPCLSFQIGHCTAPCVGEVDKKQYSEQLKDFLNLVKGRKKALINKWQKAMKAASKAMDYEEAAAYRDRLQMIDLFYEQQEQGVELDIDKKDRDFWAFYEGKAHEENPALLQLYILHYRDGVWVGQNKKTVVLESMGFEQSKAELLKSLLLQYYLKQPVPDEIVFTEDLLSNDLELRDALLHLKEQAQSEESSLDLSLSPWKECFKDVLALAEKNVKQAYDEALEDKRRSGGLLKKLAHFLKLNEPPAHIECIDISNFQGSANVASVVVFKNAKPDNASYRHFKIKALPEGSQDDFGSIREVMRRRYAKEDSVRPNLIVIDGGLGQLNAALSVVKDFDLNLEIVSIAKARTESNFRSANIQESSERIFFPGRKNPKKLPEGEVKNLLTHLRDEAHRFAINFHRKQRDQIK